MSKEFFSQEQPAQADQLIESSIEGVTEYPNLADFFASAEEGFPAIPNTREVADIETLARETNMDPAVLEGFRNQHSPD